jgi:putative Mn2+ efflux pump MntP
MIGKLASSTTATIAISLVVLIGMYILYRDMKKKEVSIEKLQTRSACAKVLATPPSVIEGGR